MGIDKADVARGVIFEAILRPRRKIISTDISTNVWLCGICVFAEKLAGVAALPLILAPWRVRLSWRAPNISSRR
jgi:hypothetical protein